MNIRQCLEITASYAIPKISLDIIEKIFGKFNMKLPFINKNGVIFACSITKLLNSFLKVDNNIGIMISTYIRQLSKNKSNYFTILLFILSLSKKYSKYIKTKYFKFLYIACISNVIYNWSYKPEKINKSLLNFLDKGCGLNKRTIQDMRGEMSETGWVSSKITNPNGNCYDLILNSFPRSVYNISKVFLANEFIVFILKKIFNKKYSFNVNNKINNILFLSSVFQLPILMISVYNQIYKNKKPNKLLIYLLTLLSGTPIFMTNRTISKNTSLFLLVCLLTRKYNSLNIKLPNSFIIANSSEYLLENNKNYINGYINKLLNIN